MKTLKKCLTTVHFILSDTCASLAWPHNNRIDRFFIMKKTVYARRIESDLIIPLYCRPKTE